MILPGGDVSSLLISCEDKCALESDYVPALRLGGWTGEILLASAGWPVPSLEGVAGLLLTGGWDVHPRWWDPQEPLHPRTRLDAARDDLEMPLIREAWRRALPILGICRGVQALNVALGGSLVQDIPGRFGVPATLHRRGTAEQPEEAHPVAVAPDSRLAGLVGGATATVNSRHHQAVLRVAPCLRAVAWHRDPGNGSEVVEGIEAPDPRRWVVGVQWHPENLVGLDNRTGKAALGLFQGFARALAAGPASPCP